MTLASPFGDPDPRARAAAEELAAQLRRDASAARELYAPNGGKMFGVLLVEDAGGRRSVLRAFSGMFRGTWQLPGFVGPAFDAAERDAFWIAGEASLDELAAQLATLDEEHDSLRRVLAPIEAGQAAELAALTARHTANKVARHAARATATASDAINDLARQSRADTLERKRLLAGHATARGELATRLRSLDARRAALAHQRAERSRALWLRIQDTYRFANARGELRALRSLFDPVEPPGGAGDCAAPKLFAEAYRRGLQPIALAEIWIGAPPATGGRSDGTCYPACRGKCGPILAHVLGGLDVASAPVFGGGPVAADEPRVVLEDRWLVVVDKPVGLLAVPGRGDALRDSVLVRLRERYPDATGPMIVHRLDLDTSGLMLVAKDEATHKALQAQFARREIDKRYVAWLDGLVPDDAGGGTIELALRVDLDDRPRQIHDPIHGKHAVTEWRVLARDRPSCRTRVELVPRTGRTHQLRVHAAHPLGIGIAIAGDRLYGRGGDRLLLHAESLAFEHPQTGARIALERTAPF